MYLVKNEICRGMIIKISLTKIDTLTTLGQKLPPGLRTAQDEECGRWGEVDKEKGPVDLFPTEPTDVAFMPRRP